MTILQVTAPSVTLTRFHTAVARVVQITPQTTLYYRATDGTRGSVTSAADLPVGAVVERAVTT